MFGFLRPKPKPAPDPYVKQDDAQTYRVRVRTLRHGEIVEFRFTKSAHIGLDDDGNYFFRKPVVSPKFFDRGEFLVQFDDRYHITGVSGEGVEFVPVTEWEDAETAPSS